MSQGSSASRGRSVWQHSAAIAAQLLREVMNMKESTTYQAILEEGEAKGVAKGIAMGKAEGAVSEARKLLLLQGEKLFGPPDADTATTIGRIDNLRRLEDLTVRLLDAHNWRDLLGKTAPRRRGGRRRRTS
jgi:hypothetical protein